MYRARVMKSRYANYKNKIEFRQKEKETRNSWIRLRRKIKICKEKILITILLFSIMKNQILIIHQFLIGKNKRKQNNKRKL